MDAVSAFWQNHSNEFPSISDLQSIISDVRRHLADMDEASATRQRDNSSTDFDDNWLAFTGRHGVCVYPAVMYK